MNETLTTQAQGIVDTVNANSPKGSFGLDPSTFFSLITSLLPVLAGLFTSCAAAKSGDGPASGESPSEFLTTQYDENAKQYTPWVDMRSHAATFAHFRRSGHRISHPQAKLVSSATLDAARTASPETMENIGMALSQSNVHDNADVIDTSTLVDENTSTILPPTPTTPPPA